MATTKKTLQKPYDDILVATEKINLALLDSHLHYLSGDIEEYNVNETIKWIIYENLIPEDGKILTIMINSYGGELSQAFALIDIMKNSKYPIRTIGIGAVMSAAFLIFASGKKGERFISRNASIMCHQYSTNAEGKHHDMKAYEKEMKLTDERMLAVLKQSTNLSLKTIRAKLLPESDVWMDAQELIDLGIADSYLHFK
jgi:ATP-dependent Clp protease protease subunit